MGVQANIKENEYTRDLKETNYEIHYYIINGHFYRMRHTTVQK